MNNNLNAGTMRFVACVLMMALTGAAFAAATDLGTMATTITSSFASVTRLITASSYLAGLGFSIGAILKFKQHKDNPSNIPVGTPIALLFIAAALLFLPTILDITGETMFGGEQQPAGPSGILYGEG